MSELSALLLEKTIEKTTKEEREKIQKILGNDDFHDKYIFTQPELYNKLLDFWEKILHSDLYQTGYKLISITSNKDFNTLVNKTKKYAVCCL